jgi:hypothetical protein
MQKLKLQNSWDDQSKSFDKDKFEIRETDGTISGKVSISSKKGDKWISKPMPFTAFKSKIDEETKATLLQSGNQPFQGDFNIAVDSFADKVSGKEISYFKIIINQARGESISQHSVDKGNGYAPQSNHVEEENDDEIPF